MSGILPLGPANPNYPYPSAAELAAERQVAAIEAEQRRSIDALTAALQVARAAIADLTFPLGLPCTGYDIADVLATLDDMVPETDEWAVQRMRDAAWEKVNADAV